MSGWTKFRDTIRAEVGALPRRVVVVEGMNDKAFIESLLTQRAPGAWEPNWVIGVAGKKGHLLDILEDQPNWFGLTDRDEWTAADAAAQQARFPNRLFVLPRYCMESYFTVANELWTMLGASQQANVAAGPQGFEAALIANVPQWVRHGALWHTVNPLWAGIRALGFKEALLEFAAAQQGDALIEAKLNQWHTYLDPHTIMASFQTNLATATAAPLFDKLTQWIHGKYFFRETIATVLPGLLGVPAQSADKTLADLQKRMTLPADLQSIWNAIGLP